MDYMLDKTATLIKKLVVNEKNMLRNIGATGGMIFSQRIMLELINKGATRMEAYDIVQGVALKAYKDKRTFEVSASENEYMLKYLSDAEIKDCFDLGYHLKNIGKVFKNIGIK